MIFLSFFSSSAIIPIKCGASGQIDLQLTSWILKCEKNQRNIYMAANGTQFHFVVLINDFRALQQFPPQNEQKSGADRKRTAN